MDFANGKIKRLITKAKMTGMGLNWQHCNHSVFFFLLILTSSIIKLLEDFGGLDRKVMLLLI